LGLSWRQTEDVVDRALSEDSVWNDVTTNAVVPADVMGKASIVARAEGVVAGVELARAVFHRVDPSLRFEAVGADGDWIQPGDVLANLEGKAASILRAERVSLNFLQRLSGIATEARRYVEAIGGLTCRILDTRKTTPGLRPLEKYAVRMGGAHNHRLHLGDGILIKDNHLAVLRSQGMSLEDAVRSAKEKAPLTLKVEVEVGTAEEAVEAVEAGAEIVMLDNMSLEEMRRAVELVKGRALLEASGGITLDNVRQVAETGIDFISVGALTHSARSLDFSLEM
jgi:nicotinate-nucleotide pyrophosphorylase (carboxylating)